MKPVILTSRQDETYSFIADEHAVASLVSPVHGDHRLHYETAICIKDLKPGEFHWRDHDVQRFFGVASDRIAFMDETMMGQIYPAPCMLAVDGDFYKQSFDGVMGMPLIKGIWRETAEAMLHLAASKMNVQTEGVNRSWKFGDPRSEGATIPWDNWKFLLAWFWSDWESRKIQSGKKITQKQRWEEFCRIGYPYKLKAFEAMHRDLFGKPTH